MMYNIDDDMGNETATNDTDDADYGSDYDYSAALVSFAWGELLPALVIYSIIFCLGLTGNFKRFWF